MLGSISRVSLVLRQGDVFGYDLVGIARHQQDVVEVRAAWSIRGRTHGHLNGLVGIEIATLWDLTKPVKLGSLHIAS